MQGKEASLIHTGSLEEVHSGSVDSDINIFGHIREGLLVISLLAGSESAGFWLIRPKDLGYSPAGDTKFDPTRFLWSSRERGHEKVIRLGRLVPYI